MVHFWAIHRCRFVYLNYFVSMCRHCPFAVDADCRAVYLCRPSRPQYLMVHSPSRDCHLDRMRQRHIGTAMLLFEQQHYKYCQRYSHVCLFWFDFRIFVFLYCEMDAIVWNENWCQYVNENAHKHWNRNTEKSRKKKERKGKWNKCHAEQNVHGASLKTNSEWEIKKFGRLKPIRLYRYIESRT